MITNSGVIQASINSYTPQLTSTGSLTGIGTCSSGSGYGGAGSYSSSSISVGAGGGSGACGTYYVTNPSGGTTYISGGGGGSGGLTYVNPGVTYINTIGTNTFTSPLGNQIYPNQPFDYTHPMLGEYLQAYNDRERLKQLCEKYPTLQSAFEMMQMIFKICESEEVNGANDEE